jgi:hypothetical protein
LKILDVLSANAVPQQVGQKGRRPSNTLLTARLNAPVQQITQQQVVQQLTQQQVVQQITQQQVVQQIAHQQVVQQQQQQQPQLQQSLLSPQPARMSALTSQLNAPPVIAPAQPFVNFSYAVPGKMVGTLRPAQATIVTTATGAFTQAGLQVRQMSPQQEQSNLGLAMPGLSALLAGTPSADNPMPGAPTSSTPGLLERLTSPTVVPTYVATAPTPPSPLATSQSPKPITPSPMSSPSSLSLPNINLQLASLQEAMARVPAFQNVQVRVVSFSLAVLRFILNGAM